MSLPALEIIKKLSALNGRTITLDALARGIGLNEHRYADLRRFVDMLVAVGVLRHEHKQRYVVRKPLTLVEGVVALQPSGYAFLVPCGDHPEHEDIYLSKFHLESAMDGDTAVALVVDSPGVKKRGGRQRRAAGLVIEVQQRAHKTVVALCKGQRSDGKLICRSLVQGQEFVVAPRDDDQLQELSDQYVVLDVERYPVYGSPGIGHVVRGLGVAGTAQTDIRVAAYQQGVPTEFSPEVLREAQYLELEVREEDFAHRADLRMLPLVTIDGSDARDYDDAVAVESTESGWKLWVAIADVSHYVEPGSAIDRSAYERGTSVYFPGFCLPMLPESLSNGVCSLQPDVDRLAVVVALTVDMAGQVDRIQLNSAVIRSRARLTYEQVQDCLHGVDGCDVGGTIVPMLSLMAQLSELLRARRLDRGAIDFDVPEAEIRLDNDGMPAYIGRRQRTDAHRLIEEFMLAANEAVAQWVEERGASSLYRVHDSPDLQSIQALQQFVGQFNLGFNIAEEGISSHVLQRLLSQIKNTQQEYSVNQVLLRSMAQAHYSAENSGHFGLASERYCHFTSPIRRYPDLVQHRIVLSLLGIGRRYTHTELDKIASHCSTTERRAVVAERDIIDLRKCQFMLDKMGLRFTGFITSVAEFGFFVELNEFFVEGLIHIRTLVDDFYSYEAEKHLLIGQRRRRIFQVGMAVTVTVDQVRSDQRQIDFVLSDMESERERKKSSFVAKKKLHRSGSGRRGTKQGGKERRRHR